MIRSETQVDGLGQTVTWIIPYRYGNGNRIAAIRLVYYLNLESKEILHDFLHMALAPVFALSISFLVLNFLIRRRVTKPIGLISERMISFSQDSSWQPEALNIRSEDEIGRIAASFGKMTEEISTYIGNIETLTQERVEADVQMDVARRIQYGLVPDIPGRC